MDKANVYYSRGYLREKYSRIKNDMENYLAVLDEEKPDSIPKVEIDMVRSNLVYSLNSIVKELNKGV